MDAVNIQPDSSQTPSEFCGKYSEISPTSGLVTTMVPAFVLAIQSLTIGIP